MGSMGLTAQHMKLARKIDGRIRGMIGEKGLIDKFNKKIHAYL